MTFWLLIRLRIKIAWKLFYIECILRSYLCLLEFLIESAIMWDIPTIWKLQPVPVKLQWLVNLCIDRLGDSRCASNNQWFFLNCVPVLSKSRFIDRQSLFWCQGVFAFTPPADQQGNLKSHLVFMKQIELWPRVYDIRGNDTDYEFFQFIQLLISQPVFTSQKYY